MLRRLLVKNLAIIKELEVHFNPGLNMITGETGSGKSILIDAIGLLMGGRAPGDIIRTGEEVAIVEGELVSGEDNHLIRRVLRAGGSSRIFLNDEPIKLSELEDLTGNLVDLHGQHEHQSLLRINTHLDFLDSYAGLLPDREVLAHTYHHLTKVSKELRDLTEVIEREQELNALHQSQLEELEAAGISTGEADELDKEHKLLAQADELQRHLSHLAQRLQKDDLSLASELDGLRKPMERFAGLSKDIQSIVERMDSLTVELEDLAFEVERCGSQVHPDSERMTEVEERLGELETIKRKYGGTLDTALEKLAWLREAMSQKSATDERLNQLRIEKTHLEEAYAAQCQELSQQRQAAKQKLEQDIQDTLAYLDMPGTRFEIRFQHLLAEQGLCHIDGHTYRGDERGYDQVEFFISPNPGEELRPLAKVASGGEISRIMLGIKTVLAAYDPVDCLIFDEIDYGISGSTAETVGAALRGLAKSRQVICITHLPQIAASGDHHLSMDKEVKGGRTLGRARVVEGEERRLEIARLLSGAEITQASMDQALELLAPVSEKQGADSRG
ncbi:MAG: DNA repair protein RecN [Fidelibacterota bacterium]|nr:MAG: DNA repair protein RecN [Candidatus Neomarinimicrobiota bacterium]